MKATCQDFYANVSGTRITLCSSSRSASEFIKTKISKNCANKSWWSIIKTTQISCNELFVVALLVIQLQSLASGAPLYWWDTPIWRYDMMILSITPLMPPWDQPSVDWRVINTKCIQSSLCILIVIDNEPGTWNISVTPPSTLRHLRHRSRRWSSASER